MRVPRPKIRTVMGSLAAFSVGIAVAVLVIPHPPPAGLHTLPIEGDWQVTFDDFTDPRSVPLRLDVIRLADPRVGTSGVVTTSSCRPGATISSGTSPLSINNSPILALYSSVPFWRDLTIGDTGPDVRALERQLATVAGDIAVDDTFGSSTARALRMIQKKVGAQETGRLDLTHVMWLPAPDVVIAECPAAVGEQIEAREVAVVSEATLAAATLAPTVPFRGGVGIRIGETVVPLGEESKIEDGEVLAALRRDPEIAEAIAQSAPEVSVTVELIEPIQVAAVPPAAIVIDGTGACVYSDGTAIPVTIVSASLGQSYIEFPREIPSAVSMAPERETCS